MLNEIWKDVVGYVGMYCVSDLGNIRSPAKVDARGNNLKPQPIKLSPDGLGYPMFCACKGGKQRSPKVHRLVLEAFVGPCPEGMECCHRDDVKTNNKLNNLYWGTKSQNMGDRKRNANYSSSYIGVSLRRDTSKWVARVNVKGKRQIIGNFTDEHDAAHAYNDYCDLHKLTNHRNEIVR